MLIFISYSRADKALISELVEDISALGHTSWHDSALAGGQLWWDVILEQLRSCDCVLFVTTEVSCASEACRRERDYAIALGKTFIPVIVHSSVLADALPSELRDLQHVHYWTRDRAALRQLSRAVSGLAQAQFRPAPLPNPLPFAPEPPVSDMAVLHDRLEARPLPPDEQLTLILELKHWQEDPAKQATANALLKKLLQREDVTVTAAARAKQALRASPVVRRRERDLQASLAWPGTLYLAVAWASGAVSKAIVRAAGTDETMAKVAAGFVALIILSLGSYRIWKGLRQYA